MGHREGDFLREAPAFSGCIYVRGLSIYADITAEVRVHSGYRDPGLHFFTGVALKVLAHCATPVGYNGRKPSTATSALLIELGSLFVCICSSVNKIVEPSPLCKHEWAVRPETLTTGVCARHCSRKRVRSRPVSRDVIGIPVCNETITTRHTIRGTNATGRTGIGSKRPVSYLRFFPYQELGSSALG